MTLAVRWYDLVAPVYDPCTGSLPWSGRKKRSAASIFGRRFWEPLRRQAERYEERSSPHEEARSWWRHYCLGANLARAEMQEALAVLAPRMPDLRIDGEVHWRPLTGITGPIVLPLAFTPTA